ncbi:flagellar hook-basal body complex protein [Peptococcaceae bacterium 1198_IL3148]
MSIAQSGSQKLKKNITTDDEVNLPKGGESLFRGIYTTLSGMGVQQSRLDLITSNLANVESKGYKSDQIRTETFGEVLIHHQSPNQKGLTPVGPSNMGSAVAEVYIDMTQGDLSTSGEYTDLALDGKGFYVLQAQTEQGQQEFYSRDSSFYVDKDGYLVNTRGDKLLSESGPIKVGDKKFEVDQKGRLTIDGETRPRYTLRVVEFADTRALKKEGEKYFSPTEEAEILPSTETKVLQGVIESSNVDTTVEMTNMIQVMRTYQAGQRLMQAHDELLNKAANQLGSLR